ncbi:Glutamine synthetase [Candidatus Trichorickettsia mobilis]|uniref:Glutamine synthetase n=1 Tax=Candidatus Trichorickettsia mobilis TaxID=1346319 RepID=A0ABZ0UVM7_9RICK|nr:type I glutamate--ammonia ligase [Candidatus Trichorickettsia mobilis]WPY00969.1 Glutamine synthetase [Candidatus Trichorickettsia mobilis]
MANYQNFLHYLKQHQIYFVDFRFTDLHGVWHHITYPVSMINEELLNGGIFFDGSSIQYWCAINQSDMLLIPDISPNLDNIAIDPFADVATVIVTCDVFDPLNLLPYKKDPRYIAKQAEKYLQQTGIADTAYFGPEVEFFIFDSVHFQSNAEHCFYNVKSDEFTNNNGAMTDNNHGCRPKAKGGYFPVTPLDSMHNIRSKMLIDMQAMGLEVEKHHHEVAPAQHEIGIKYRSLLHSADAIQTYKYVVRNAARSYGKTASFMAKPLFADNGSGMHVHQSLWLNGNSLFAGMEYANLSEIALYYIGGILKHAKSLNAFTNPTTNSYKRLVPGFEAPVICAYSMRNRSAACRIPVENSPSAKRVEIRFPDPTANPYLAFAAMLMAGIDGIQNKIHPGESHNEDLFEDKEIAKTLPSVAGSLREALVALEQDNSYLLVGEVFSKELLTSYLEMKWKEVTAIEQFPHPLEFSYYYNN